jgi:primase-polymerase (primpol)-like protein
VNAAARFAIPVDLRDRRQWLVWRREHRDGKPTKVPYRASSPTVRASTTDAHTWASFEHAVTAVMRGKADGLGYVFTVDDPFTGVDLDGCRGEGGELNAKAAEILAALDSYSEWSPSGRGLHIIVRARLDGGRCRRGPVELYDRARFFTVTGARLLGVPHAPMPRQRQLDELRARLFPPPKPPAARPTGPGHVADDQELLARMFKARNGADVERLFRGDTTGYASASEADMALVAHLAFWTGGDPVRIDVLFRASGLMREKWERTDYRERTIAKALNGG